MGTRTAASVPRRETSWGSSRWQASSNSRKRALLCWTGQTFVVSTFKLTNRLVREGLELLLKYRHLPSPIQCPYVTGLFWWQ
jgi:hypothetical protein